MLAKKKNLYNEIICRFLIILVLIFILSTYTLPGPLFAEYSPQQKVVIMFKEGIFDFPSTKLKVSIQKAQFKNSEIYEILLRNNAQEITKAVPGFKQKDTITFLKTGEKIHLIDLSKIYVISFATESDALQAINNLKKNINTAFIESDYVPGDYAKYQMTHTLVSNGDFIIRYLVAEFSGRI